MNYLSSTHLWLASITLKEEIGIFRWIHLLHVVIVVVSVVDLFLEAAALFEDFYALVIMQVCFFILKKLFLRFFRAVS